MLAACLDTCVLYPPVLADCLLRCAVDGLYRAHWSPAILDELRRNVAERTGVGPIDRRITQMRRALPDAEVTGYEHLTPVMRNEPKDKHVLAAAVHGGCELVVTYNLRDFPATALDPVGVEAVHPDAFLVLLHEHDPERVRRCLQRQVAAYRKPPQHVDELLTVFARRHHLPQFAAAAAEPFA